MCGGLRETDGEFVCGDYRSILLGVCYNSLILDVLKYCGNGLPILLIQFAQVSDV